MYRARPLSMLGVYSYPLFDRWRLVAVPSFAKDIKPLFREKDRSSMRARFDLWSCQDVRRNAPAILEALRAETMPCDGPWSSENVERFNGWIAGGMAD
jgi:hypothetical protein